MPWVKDPITGERTWFPSGGVSRETVAEMIKESRVQVDYNQNDDTANDYIRNRPFYEITDEIVIAEQQEVVLSDGAEIPGYIAAGAYYGYISHLEKLYGNTTVGVTKYHVYYNEVLYECVLSSCSIGYLLGNKSLYNKSMDDTGEPFCLINGNDFRVYTYDTTSCNIKIIQLNNKVVQLDEKYIPNTIARTKDLPAEMTGATADTAGSAGLVPAPAAGDDGKVLFGSGAWGEIPSADVWEPILAFIAPRPTLVNLGGMEGISETTSGNPFVTVNAAGTVEVVFPLGASFSKLYFMARSSATTLCTAGNVKITLPELAPQMRDMTELSGQNTWANMVWQLEMGRGFITQYCTGKYTEWKTRAYDGNESIGVSQIKLVTTTADATFNNFGVEIWGVRA